MNATAVATAKLFMNGRSQAVRLPAGFRFAENEVHIRKDPATGDVILSRKPGNWDSLFALIKNTEVPADFLAPETRDQGIAERDPFADWAE